MDSTFYPALVLMAAWVKTMGRFGRGDSLLAEADSLFQLADGYRGRMSEAERLFLQTFHDSDAGPEARLRTMRRLAELAPYYRVPVAFAAFRAYRPREALELLARVDTADPNVARHMGRYGAVARGARHQLQNHDEELEVARAARHKSPRDLGVLEDYLRAVAASGRMDELNALLDTVFALPMQRLPSGRFRTPATVAANFVAMELRAHGYPDAAREVLQRALDWLEARPGEEAEQIGSYYSHSSYSHALADCLYKLERWEDARAVYEELLADSPQDTVALARLGAVAARLGEGARARAISEQLAGMPGGQSLGRAKIAALLGERGEAVELLREALHKIGTTGINRNWGWFMMQRHWEMDLESLRGYPPFEQFMRPRG
jgi:tetratricopeptide (TPR) repeat protein